MTAAPLFSPVDGAPVPDTTAVDIAQLQRRNRELVAQVEALTTALHAANNTPRRSSTTRAETDTSSYWSGNGS